MGWQGAATFAAQLTQAGAAILIASRVAPGEYALWGFAAVLFNAQYLLTSLGLAPALVHQRDDGSWRSGYDSAFTVTLGVSAIVGLALFLGADGVVGTLAPDLAGEGGQDVVRAMAAVLVCVAVSQVPLAALERRFDFRRKALAELAGTALYVAVVLVLLVAGVGVWSLLAAKIAQVGLVLGLSLLLAVPRPRLSVRVEWPLLRGLVRFGGVLGLSAIVGVLFTNLDTVIVARWFGSERLGAYAFAFSIATVVPTLLSATAGRVFFAVVSAVRDDADQLPPVVIDFAHICALLIFPVVGFQALLGPDVVAEVFGVTWQQTGDLLVPMSAYALARVVALVVNTVGSGTGRPGVVLQVELIALGAALAGVAIFGSRSAVAVAVAFAAGQWVGAIVGLVRVRGQLLPTRAVVLRAAALTVLAVVVAEGTARAAGALAALLVGLVAYAVLVLVFDRRVMRFASTLRGARRRVVT